MTMHTHTYQYDHSGPTSPRATTTEVNELDETLAQLEATRLRQLSALADTTTDLVAIAYRDSVARILSEIRTARRRLHDGMHGVCLGCHGRIHTERIEALPWATQCADCAGRRYR